jgi:hypothetical protein
MTNMSYDRVKVSIRSHLSKKKSIDYLGWEFRFWILIPGRGGIRNSASNLGIPEISLRK